MATLDSENKLKGRKVSWTKLHRVDSLNVEAGKVSLTPSGHASKVYFKLFIRN